MLNLDNHPIATGDEVYDLLNGYGEVIDATGNGIFIRFHNGKRLTFDNEGRYNNLKRIYWHNPVMVTPPKLSDEWRSTKKVIASVIDLLNVREQGRDQNPV